MDRYWQGVHKCRHTNTFALWLLPLASNSSADSHATSGRFQRLLGLLLFQLKVAPPCRCHASPLRARLPSLTSSRQVGAPAIWL